MIKEALNEVSPSQMRLSEEEVFASSTGLFLSVRGSALQKVVMLANEISSDPVYPSSKNGRRDPTPIAIEQTKTDLSSSCEKVGIENNIFVLHALHEELVRVVSERIDREKLG
ncbi:MAG: hypothetical protein HYT07_02690 [Candidatus Levybacteria bacterium]|nr:hypothetical protein [Candidatus Levybacteria bacterium]